MRTIEPIARFDLAISLFFLQHRFSHDVARVGKAISHTGDGHLYVLIGLSALLIDKEAGHLFLGVGLLAFAIELPIYWLVKNSIRRKRPEALSNQLNSFITPSDRYSLPSGHTSAAFVMATLLGQFYPDSYFMALIWATLVGASRVVLGVHFLTDVVVGAALGVGCTTFAFHLLGVQF
ncbi:phosphatase PAP2 family protein [Vibrio sp. VB16]|uniref:phosphatase PAP2 family protein n=1 Tax=Vibrio sp. VB16 TaxID=2785746 RepID=UPI00189F17D2|nr:phosphatase PAP2 family protein [Vibrio sp. VB16]UGA54468.1 phosphatase PAP2 family protein [Vibrio sp. VB16]